MGIEIKDKIFAIAMLAAKPKRKPLANPTVGCEPWATVASSVEEAEAIGLKRALEMWPKSEGWTFHPAHALEIIIHPTITVDEGERPEPTIELIM